MCGAMRLYNKMCRGGGYLVLIVFVGVVVSWCGVSGCGARGLSPAHTSKRHNGAATRGRYIYRLRLADKAGGAFSLEHPRKFLSRKAVERRRRQGCAVDSTDLPVSAAYLDALRADSMHVVGVSKWNNTVLVSVDDTAAVVGAAKRHPFVLCAERVYVAPDTVARAPREDNACDTAFNPWDTIATSPYGVAERQIRMLGGEALHDAGYNALDMTIAVLDGGFRNADAIPAIKGIRIVGARDFVTGVTDDMYKATDHGTKVLSVMGTFARNVFIGTAPAARYYLLRCEDNAYEQPVEEDYWVMAAEYADSVGADIINSSVGYALFDGHRGDHRYRELDGHSTLISRAASMLVLKGIVLVCSAGNNGMDPWKKINVPADADSIIAVGAITDKGVNAPFSSVGPTHDGRVKPDVMAPGSPTAVISGRGNVMHDMGTSFATPVVCGLVACLWQALPDKTAAEIISLVIGSCDNTDCPDNIFGYGVPDFGKAYETGRAEQ